MAGRLLRFDEFMEIALYDPVDGFFAGRRSTGGEAGGYRGDFITSPEVGPLFGTLVGRFIDRCWEEAGQPDVFDVVEYAAGRGALAIAVAAAHPECSAAMRYHMVERSQRLRNRQLEHLATSEPDGIAAATGAQGPRFLSHANESTLPDRVDLILANELVDNIPFRIFERDEEWNEVLVEERDESDSPGTKWAEATSPAETQLRARLDGLVPAAPPGARVPLQAVAGEWLSAALSRVGLSGGAHPNDRPTGRVVVIDYCRTTPEMAALPMNEWLRTYRNHDRGGLPTESPGTQDITCDVATDQLTMIRPPTHDVDQVSWLTGLGIDELVEQGRVEWESKAKAPDLSAFRARSRIVEASALCDPSGLGSFRVLVWA